MEKARAAEEAAKNKEAEKEMEVGRVAEALEAGKAKALEELKQRLEEEKAEAMADAESKQVCVRVFIIGIERASQLTNSNTAGYKTRTMLLASTAKS